MKTNCLDCDKEININKNTLCRKCFNKRKIGVTPNYKTKKVSWNKGLTRETDARVNKNSIAMGISRKGKPGHLHSKESKDKISKARKEYCNNNIEERIRLREIGRKGGFGIKGETTKGNIYSSLFEKKCIEYLEKTNIVFQLHKSLPDSSKESDVYLVNYDMWIELDGINRNKRKHIKFLQYNRWIEKINEYVDKNLKYFIIYEFEDFVSFIEKLIASEPQMDEDWFCKPAVVGSNPA